MNGCLEPEVLAAYVDQGLSLAERARVEGHLASCPHCVAMVAGVVRTVAEVSALLPVADAAEEATPRVDRRTLVGMLTAAAAVLAVLVVPSMVRPWLDRDTGLVSLADSIGDERSVLGRLTGGFPHAPLGVPSAGGQGGRAAKADRIVLSAGKIRESFGERETPSRLHALGVQQLLAGRYDDAAQSLLAAAREQPNNARYLSDLSAVQLERARIGLRPDDLPRALASADRARRLDPSLREAWFNRALAATALSLRDQAKVAWSEYLALDGMSAWAAEARTRLEELSQPTAAAAWSALEPRLQGPIDADLADEAVRTQTTEARNFVETELLPKWAAAIEAGSNGSAERERVRVMADAFLRISGDALYRDAVAAIDRAETQGGGALSNLAAAHRTYAEAAAIFAEDRFADATVPLTSARAALASAGTSFSQRAELDMGAVGYFRGQADAALRLLDNLQSSARASSYENISARVTWQQGLIAFGQGRLGDAQARYEETLAQFERMGDAEQTAAAHNLLASLHLYLGDEAQSWSHRERALAGVAITRSPRLKYALLVGATTAIRRQDAEAALTLQNAVVESALAWGRKAAVAESAAQRATAYMALSRKTEARKDLARARLALQDVSDVAFRDRIEVSLLSAESDLLRLESPSAAVSAAERAIRLVGERRDRRRLAQLNLRLAKANIVWGRYEEAEQALARGIDAFDEERSSLSDEGRLSTLDESWQLYETAVHLAIKKKDYPRAFSMAERARTRSVAEWKHAPSEFSLSDLQRTMEAGEALLTLDQFEDELAVWVIRRDSTNVTIRPITREDAQRLVDRQRDEIRHESQRPVASSALFNEILRPSASALAGITRLAVVADAPYQDAAFAAFWDGSAHRFLVENVTLTMASSAAGFAAAHSANRVSNGARGPLVLAGPGQRAQAGAEAVAAVYESASVLTGSAATRNRFFADAPGRPMVHLAARTAANQAFPLLSRLLLADEPGRPHSGAVLGHEIAASPLAQTDLVVIDEVETDNRTRGEGTLSLARAFMAAGVPAVLGTLPGADETAARDLMVGFHRRLSSGMAAAEALTDLQRNVLQSNGRRLGAWSALVLYSSDR